MARLVHGAHAALPEGADDQVLAIDERAWSHGLPFAAARECIP
jgi:hypothetical protein